jgi:hypothetical protein
MNITPDTVCSSDPDYYARVCETESALCAEEEAFGAWFDQHCVRLAQLFCAARYVEFEAFARGLYAQRAQP